MMSTQEQPQSVSVSNDDAAATVSLSVPSTSNEPQNPSNEASTMYPNSVTLTMLISDPRDADEESENESDDDLPDLVDADNEEEKKEQFNPDTIPQFSFAGFNHGNIGVPGANPFAAIFGGYSGATSNEITSLAATLAKIRDLQYEQARRQQKLADAIPRITAKMNTQLNEHKTVIEAMEIADRFKKSLVVILVDDSLAPTEQLRKVERFLLRQLDEHLSKRLSSSFPTLQTKEAEIKRAADEIGTTIFDEFIVIVRDGAVPKDGDDFESVRSLGESLSKSLYKQIIEQINEKSNERDVLRSKILDIVKDTSLDTVEKLQEITLAVL